MSSKQQRFFQAVKRAKHDPKYGDARLHKVASSIPDSDIDDFTHLKSELKMKKALLATLKDVASPPIGGLLDEDQRHVVTKEFTVEGKYEEYVKRFLGQRFSEKELEAVNTFQEVKPTKREQQQIRYETTDGFKNSTTTIIKKLREGADFVYVAFVKTTKSVPEDQQQQQPGGGDMGAGGGLGGLGGPPLMETDQPTPANDMSVPTNSDFASGTAPYEESFRNKYVPKNEAKGYISWPDAKRILSEQLPDPMGGGLGGGMGGMGAGVPPMGPTGPDAPGVGPMTTTAPMTGTPKTPEQRKKEMGIDDILVKKSSTFRDDIKGGAILAEFLKELELK